MFLKDVKKELIKDNNFIKARKKLLTDILYRTGRMIYEVRITRGMTQKELAKKLKTKQPVIASIERGNRNLSLKYLEKIAVIFKTKLIPPKFEIIEDVEEEFNREVFVCKNKNTHFQSTDNNSDNSAFKIPIPFEPINSKKKVADNFYKFIKL
ncbi:MAG: helix-turn-helix transcriptional regulator [Patescibacteria group bacterium]|jgi:transcriptional regulator with XRE-family HTH domain|nr:helix-turn-helix transcriptional regulator [Patescibacteria group bacterium]